VLESTVQAEIRKAVCGLGWARLVRNNTGRAKTINEHTGTEQWIVYGLGKGGADLVGWVQMETGIARVLCVEVKRPKGGVISPEQLAWLGAVNKRGGAAAVCRSAQSAVAFAIRARTGELFSGVPIL
jgi:VRR-NUC domain